MRKAAPPGSLPPCGGGTGRGVSSGTEVAATPLPDPPPQGGRELTEFATATVSPIACLDCASRCPPPQRDGGAGAAGGNAFSRRQDRVDPCRHRSGRHQRPVDAL